MEEEDRESGQDHERAERSGSHCKKQDVEGMTGGRKENKQERRMIV